MRVYAEGCGFGDGTEIAVADDECPSSPPNADPLLTIFLEAGQSYWIELGTWRPDLPWGAPNVPYVFNVELLCAEDTNRDGLIDVLDLIAVITTWGPCPPPCPTDVNDDGQVDVLDLTAIIIAWGPCS
jgi:hypothetical protein